MTRLPILAMVVALATACGGGDPPERTTMVPRNCAEPQFGSITSGETTSATRGTRVGVNFVRGRGLYVVDYAFVEVLRPDADLSTGGDLAILEHRNPAVLAATAKDFEASDRALALTFEGVDSEGRALPPGKYPVVFAVGAHAKPKACGGSAGASTVLTTLDWRG